MRIVLQNALSATVTIDKSICAAIENGYVLLLGIGQCDTREIADKMVGKIINLRLFKDDKGKTNLSIGDIGGSVLIVSQFTLYADCRKGNRPGFTDAAPPQKAKELYNYFLDKCKSDFAHVEHGEFGADMKLELINDGPFTLMLDSETLFK